MAPSLPFFSRSALSRKEGGVISAAHHTAMRRGVPFAKKVEFLESDGTVCVETGCVPTNASKFRIVYNISAASGGEEQAVGLYDDTSGTVNRVYLGPIGTSLRCMLIASEYNISASATNVLVDQVCDIPGSQHRAIVNGTTRTATIGNFGSFVTEKPLGIFARNNYSATAGHVASMFAKGKIYVFEAWTSGELVARFVPVVDLKGIACFYDEVDRSLHYPFVGNPLTAGPVVQGGGGNG